MYDAKCVPFYLAGHERHRTAARLQACSGYGQSAAIYSCLYGLAIDRKADLSDRLAALDLLGELGVPVASSLLDDLRDALATESHIALSGMLASVQIRAGRPRKSDIELLEQLVDDTEISISLRLNCLEGLLLCDDTKGMEERIYEVIKDAADSPDSLARRCLFAAGCSQEGRRVLSRIVADGELPHLFRSAFFLCETSLAPNDSEWESVLKKAESLALDSRTEIDLRVKASQIAYQGASNRPFRDAFIRQVLSEGIAGHFESTGWRYMGPRTGGQAYVPEFESLMEHQDVEVRRVAALLFWRSCDTHGLSRNERESIYRLVRRLLADDDFSVRQRAFELLEKCRLHDANFGPGIATEFAEVARREADLEKYAWMAASLARAFQKSLPIDPLYDSGPSYLPRKADEIRQIVSERREVFQSLIDEWTKEFQ
jgi:hypothetical protein